MLNSITQGLSNRADDVKNLGESNPSRKLRDVLSGHAEALGARLMISAKGFDHFLVIPRKPQPKKG